MPNLQFPQNFNGNLETSLRYPANKQVVRLYNLNTLIKDFQASLKNRNMKVKSWISLKQLKQVVVNDIFTSSGWAASAGLGVFLNIPLNIPPFS